MLKICSDKIYQFFDSVNEKLKIYIPVDCDKGACFKPYQKGDELTKQLNTTRSAKDFFFPQVENIVDFKVDGQNIEIIDARSEIEDFAIFGVRPCDAKSFEILDSVYLNEPVDTFYKNRREHGVVITQACVNPEKTCFCKVFGVDASNPIGDIGVYQDDEAFYFDVLTEKGENFIKPFINLFEETDGKKVQDIKKDIKDKVDNLPLSNLKAKDFTKEQLETFNSEEWKELSKACLGCGTCTFVCPTCQCYDIREFNTGNGIKRFRCWDSCMYRDFTLMAHGTPRPTQLERFRQRFMHKLVYYPMNNDGVYGCVGCGRCVKKCPISMNIVKVMKALQEEK